MKTVKDKQVLVAADFAGVEIKDAVVEHLKKNGWTGPSGISPEPCLWQTWPGSVG